MTATPSVLERFNEMPRAMRWLFIGVVFVAMFLAWDATIGAMVRQWNDEAEAIERKAADVRKAESTRARLRAMDDTIINLGPVDLPGREAEGRTALTNAVVEVFESKEFQNRVTYSFDLSGGGDKIREDISRGIVRSGGRVTRLTGSLKFESSPDDAIAVIARLESNPDIDAIRKVTISKTESRSGPRVKVALTVETWVEVSSSSRRRRV